MVISLGNGSLEEENEKPYEVRTEALIFSTAPDFLAALAVPGMLWSTKDYFWEGGRVGVLVSLLCASTPSETRGGLQQWRAGALPMCNIWKGFPFLVQIRFLEPAEGKLLWALLRMVYVWCAIRQKNQRNERGFLKYVIYFPDSELNNFRISSP